MADEARLTIGLQVVKDNLKYKPPVSSFRIDVDGSKGPTPGALTITTAGEQVLFSELTTPGLCRIINYDGENYIEYGIQDPATSQFYPLGEVGPGEEYVIKLSRNLRQAYLPETGTGTTSDVNALYLKATGGSCNVSVEAFEK